MTLKSSSALFQGCLEVKFQDNPWLKAFCILRFSLKKKKQSLSFFPVDSISLQQPLATADIPCSNANKVEFINTTPGYGCLGLFDVHEEQILLRSKDFPRIQKLFSILKRSPSEIEAVGEKVPTSERIKETERRFSPARHCRKPNAKKGKPSAPPSPVRRKWISFDDSPIPKLSDKVFADLEEEGRTTPKTQRFGQRATRVHPPERKRSARVLSSLKVQGLSEGDLSFGSERKRSESPRRSVSPTRNRSLSPLARFRKQQQSKDSKSNRGALRSNNRDSLISKCSSTLDASSLPRKNKKPPKAVTFGARTKNKVTFKLKKKAASAKVRRFKKTKGRKGPVLPNLRSDIRCNLKKQRNKSEFIREFLREKIMAQDSLLEEIIRGLDEKGVDEIIKVMHRVETSPEQNILEQGKSGKDLYIIQRGTYKQIEVHQTVDPFKRVVAGRPHLMKILGEGDIVGETGLLYDYAAPFTVKSVGVGIIWVLGKTDFEGVLRAANERMVALKQQMATTFLTEHIFVKEFEKELLSKALAEVLDFRKIPAQEIILSYEEPMDKVFFIIEGRFSLKENPPSVRKLGSLRPKSIFWSGSTAKGAFPKSPYVLAASIDSAVLEVSMFTLQRIINSQPKNEKYDTTNKRQSAIIVDTIDLQVPLMLKSKRTKKMKRKFKALQMDSFDLVDPLDSSRWMPVPPLIKNLDFVELQPLQKIGEGNFGSVFVVEYSSCRKLSVISAGTTRTQTERQFALKAVSRSNLTKNGWEAMANHETMVMAELSFLVCSDFVVKLYHSFADSKNIYLLLELCIGGDLDQLLYNSRRGSETSTAGSVINLLDEASVRFYAACILEGLDALRSRNIVLRDLKPENIFIGASGYVKLGDFGLCTRSLRTFTFCGTPEYIAPEVISRKGYNYGVDLWALGVVLFELLLGRTPFEGDNELETFQLILQHCYVDVSEVKSSDDAQEEDFLTVVHRDTSLVNISIKCLDLMNKLLQPTTGLRIGCGKGGNEEIKCHDFFKDFNWEDLRAERLVPPFVPDGSFSNDIACDPGFVYQEDDSHEWEPFVNTKMKHTPEYNLSCFAVEW